MTSRDEKSRGGEAEPTPPRSTAGDSFIRELAINGVNDRDLVLESVGEVGAILSGGFRFGLGADKNGDVFMVFGMAGVGRSARREQMALSIKLYI